MRVNVYQDTHSYWRWTTVGRGGNDGDLASRDGFPLREQARADARASLGSEFETAYITMDGSSGNGAPPPLPVVDASSEAVAAGTPV